ncbi:hypothetical protein KKF70_06670 [bacterium]|nr:hypothetical protein [bacterium]
MNEALQLYGKLVITFLGLVIPVISIILSIFRDGMEKVAAQYENERSQSEKNLKDQLAKVKDSDIKLEDIKKTIKALEKTEKNAKSKLKYLEPKYQIIFLLICFAGSFLLLISAHLFGNHVNVFSLLLTISVGFFIRGFINLINLFSIIVEVKKNIDDTKNEEIKNRLELENEKINILKIIAKKENEHLLKKVKIVIDSNDIIKDNKVVITIDSDKEKTFDVRVANSESRMAKEVEIGFVFPPSFMIVKGTGYSIFTSEDKKILRYNINPLHGKTKQILSDLKITPLTAGEYDITTFIKAENMESIYNSFKVIVK